MVSARGRAEVRFRPRHLRCTTLRIGTTDLLNLTVDLAVDYDSSQGISGYCVNTLAPLRERT